MIEMNVIDVIERREVDRDDCDVREDGGGAGGGRRRRRRARRMRIASKKIRTTHRDVERKFVGII